MNMKEFVYRGSSVLRYQDQISHIHETQDILRATINQMLGLSDEGFRNRYFNDPEFRQGFDKVVRIICSEE